MFASPRSHLLKYQRRDAEQVRHVRHRRARADLLAMELRRGTGAGLTP